MGAFKEGDWVRRTGKSKWPEQFGEVDCVYNVLSVDSAGNIVVIEGERGAAACCFEPWTPKVGERVRRVKGYNTGSDIGHIATVMEVEDISAYDSNGLWLKFTDGTSGYATSFEPLPVASEAQPSAQAVPAPLTIRAGCYYKTRDGRKVGPADTNPDNFNIGEDYNGRKAAAVIPNIGDVDAAGIWLCGDGESDHDLIAEWPTDTATTTNVAATVDAINDEYGQGLQEAPVLVATQPAPTMIRTKNGYGFELARVGDYVWVDIGQKAPITVRADSIKAA